jgi:hypothetical protein
MVYWCFDVFHMVAEHMCVLLGLIKTSTGVVFAISLGVSGRV